MSSVVISGNTSGTITLDAPAVAGTTTLTLPATSGTIVTTNTMPTGSVLQVVNATYSTSTTNASITYADTGLSASITPTSSSSKILVLVSHEGVIKANSNTKVNFKLFRGATDLGVVANAGATDTSATNLLGSTAIVYLDSPATTSSTTYKTQFSSANNTSFVGVQDSSVPSTITLLEIAS